MLEAKLCPFSFAFNLKQQMPNMIDPRKIDARIQIGFPCIKEKCSWYSDFIKDCVIYEIKDILENPIREDPEAI